MSKIQSEYGEKPFVSQLTFHKLNNYFLSICHGFSQNNVTAFTENYLVPS